MYSSILKFDFSKLQHLLEERGGDNPTNIFKFVINPNDFAQSVENIFYLSFLIRDGKVAFEMQDGEPMICKYSSLTSKRSTPIGC